LDLCPTKRRQATGKETSISIAGNIVMPPSIGSVEFTVERFGSPLVEA